MGVKIKIWVLDGKIEKGKRKNQKREIEVKINQRKDSKNIQKK